MISVAIINVTSYTGLELLRLLAQHPQLRVASVTARSLAGKRLGEVFPQLYAFSSSSSIDPAMVITEEPTKTDLAFVCLPHAAAAEAVARLLEQDTKVVDLSADFRLHDVAEYEKWYKHTHPVPALLESAVFGLPERYRAQIAGARLVANPGCHSTTAILALLPAFAHGVAEPDVIIDSKSGISGKGRSLKLDSLYSELNEDVSAYSLGGHRHLPEITQELQAAANDGGHSLIDIRMTFVPHLAPMTRGLLATCYANLKADALEHLNSPASVQELYREYYAGAPFVHVVDQPPHTKWTTGSNHCFIYPTIDTRTGRLIVVSCIDNLAKGASGQAIQNANCMYGLPETMGLDALGVNP